MKKIVILTLCFLMLTSITSGAKTLEFTMDSNIMYESDSGIQKTELENAPYTQNGRTMVPVRIISEKFGAEVSWNEETMAVTIKKDDKTIVLTLGSTEAYVNSDAYVLDVVPEEKNGRTMVPLRFISEILGMGVGYVQSTRQVLISDEEPVITVNGVNLTIEDYKAVIACIEYDPASTDDYELVDYVTKTLVEGYAPASKLVADENTDFGQIEMIYKNSAEEVYKTALFAPLAQLFESDIIISNTIDSYIRSAEFDKIAADYYAENFIRAKHILISSETRDNNEALKEAQKILTKIKKGEDFDEIMFEVSEDPGTVYSPEGYVFTYGEMVPEFESAAFGLEIGEVSDLVKSSFGYHIIKREELPDLDESMSNAIKNSMASEIYTGVINDSIEISDIVVHKTAEEIVEMLK